MKTHLMSYKRQYRIWNSMKQRCLNPNYPGYKNYGGRGITFEDNWQTFPGFWEDMSEGYADNLSIDRIDNNKGYSKKNCKWSTPKEQASNRRNSCLYKGETGTDASLRLTNGKSDGLVSFRLHLGWSKKDAFTKPLNYSHRKVKGYYYHKKAKLYHVRKSLKGILLYSGYFKTQKEAKEFIKGIEIK